MRYSPRHIEISCSRLFPFPPRAYFSHLGHSGNALVGFGLSSGWLELLAWDIFDRQDELVRNVRIQQVEHEKVILYLEPANAYRRMGIPKSSTVRLY